MVIQIREFKQSPKTKKKWMVVLYDTDEKRKKTIHFGEMGYRDYTLMHKKRSGFYEKDKSVRELTKRRYIKRHRGMGEDWNDPFSGAGFWSRFILWNKPSVKESLAFVMRKYGMEFAE